MTQYILDTDNITLLQHSNSLILQRFEILDTSDVAIVSALFMKLFMSSPMWRLL